MTKNFESPSVEENIHSPEDLPPAKSSSVETERYWPVINAEECRFIETTGGSYRGFVDERDGRREFQDFWATRTAFYDETLRQVLETFVATEGMNDENSNELRGPGDIEGFKLLVVRRTRSGEELGSPEFVPLRASDFPSGKVSVDNLRAIARELHEFAVAEAPHADVVALRDRIEEKLRLKGWRTTHSAETTEPGAEASLEDPTRDDT